MSSANRFPIRLPLIAWGLLALGPARGADALPAHPRLLFDAGEVEQIKQRIRQPAWSEAWQKFKGDFDKTIEESIELPPRGANWGHWYVCPKHGAALTTGRQIEPWKWEHICPVDQQVFHGDPKKPSRDYDGCVLGRAHGDYAQAIRKAGILYQITGDEKYARRGREILLAYADRYLSYRLHTTSGSKAVGGGRLFSQALDESVWLIPVAQGADLIWNSLTEDDRRLLAEKLFLPAAREVIGPSKFGVHNIQCWYNGAMGLTGFLLDDRKLIRAAIDDPKGGYRTQMAKGVQPDGVWREGAWSYHFYTLSALVPLVEAARHGGIDLYGEPLKRMFEAPIALAMPNMKLPAFNDSRETGLNANLYELAYARYQDPVFVRALAGSKRTEEFALWFGVDTLPQPEKSALQSHNDPSGGYGVLQRGTGQQATWLCLKYGPHGGGHGHYDKLTFVLYAGGQTICPDAGTRGYGSKLHEDWDKTTLAHNTLTANLSSQKQARGRCLAFGSDNGADYAMAEAGPVYEGLRFVRTAALLSTNLLVFVDQVQADKEQLLDVACHLNGAWEDLPAGEKFEPPNASAYRYLQGTTQRTLTAGMSLKCRGADKNLRLIVLAGDTPTDIITGTGIGKDTSDRVPVVLFRRRAPQSTFVWGLSLDGTPVTLTAKADDKAQTADVQVTAGAGSWHLEVDGCKGSVRVRPVTK